MKLILIAFVLASALADRTPRILGGRDAKPHEYPFMVALIYETGGPVRCGGTILSNLFVLTAAHCLHGKRVKDLAIKAGKHKISVKEETEQIRYVAKIFIHEKYVYVDRNSYDIGLIKLNMPLQFTNAVKAIEALPKKNTIPTGQGTMIGWGVKSYSPTRRPISADILQAADVPIIPNHVCVRSWRDLSDLFLCTGPLTGQISICDGDSGSPLVQVESGIRTVIGIASSGLTSSGTPYRPSLFVRVSAYTDWINKKMFTN